MSDRLIAFEQRQEQQVLGHRAVIEPGVRHLGRRLLRFGKTAGTHAGLVGSPVRQVGSGQAW